MAIKSGGPEETGGGGGARSSSRPTRIPVSRSSPQEEQIDIPTGITPPHVGHRRGLDRASAALGRRVDGRASSNKARASAAGFVAAGLAASRIKGRSNVSRRSPAATGNPSSLRLGGIVWDEPGLFEGSPGVMDDEFDRRFGISWEESGLAIGTPRMIEDPFPV
jgi:hypothetical protein